MPALLDEVDHLRQQIEPEYPSAQSLEKYDSPGTMPLDQIKLVAQPALAEIGDAVKIAIRRKTSAITQPVGGVRGNFGVDRDNNRRPLRGDRQPRVSARQAKPQTCAFQRLGERGPHYRFWRCRIGNKHTPARINL
jgi:hypothetical protein